VSFRDLARAAGIDVDYTSWRGEATSASDEAVLAALHALAGDLDLDVTRIEDAAAAEKELERRRWAEVGPPVALAWDGMLELPFTVPAEFDDDWEVEVTLEGGGVVRAHGRLFELSADSHAWPGGVLHCVRRARVWLEGMLGYHSAHWRTAASEGDCLVIAAPVKAYDPPGLGQRAWGVFAPVYGLANAESGEAGDLATLRQLFDSVHRRGGRYIATLPILAAFLDEPYAFSPYSPASRLYWNELYLDLRALGSHAIPPPITKPLIDYRTQYAWRRAALEGVASKVLADHQSEIETWASEHGAWDYAAFRAFGEVERRGWRSWPKPQRDDTPMLRTRAQALAFGAPSTRLDSHVVGQWAMQKQLEALAAGPVRLYLDLPVGVSCDAYEVWRWRKLFLLDLAAGAPPDALFLGGQNWGLPPLSPYALRRDRYRYFIQCVRHHMSIAGMLRIDHVMGLFRLYCVPQGRPATDGVYIRYPWEELMAIITLESSRGKCAVAGEDLGTVPDQVRPAMARHGLYRLHVGQWFFPREAGGHPTRSPSEAVASLNTHDTATFAGWWRGTDIDDKRDLDLIDSPQQHAEHVEREREKTALLAFAGAKLEGELLTEVEQAMIAVTADLAVGPAEIVLVSLDDLVLDPVPHNVPGTVTQRPNWQRRVQGWADSLDPERGSPAAAAAIAAVCAARTPPR
jgi:4-alpha-glucanotransferase